MSTRGLVGIIWPEGKISAVYLGHDAYIEGVGKILVENYNSEQQARKLLHSKFGICSMMSDFDDIIFYDDVEVGTEYYRFKDLNDIERRLVNNSSIEYTYLYDTKDQKWKYLYHEYYWYLKDLQEVVDDVVYHNEHPESGFVPQDEQNEEQEEQQPKSYTIKRPEIRPEEMTVNDINFMYKKESVTIDELKAYDKIQNKLDKEVVVPRNILCFASNLRDKHHYLWIVKNINVDVERNQIVIQYRAEDTNYFLDVKMYSKESLIGLNYGDVYDQVYEKVQQETEIDRDYNVDINIVNMKPVIRVSSTFYSSEY